MNRGKDNYLNSQDIKPIIYNSNFTPVPNETVARFQFNNRNQLPRESFLDFVNDLQKLGEFCNFTEMENMLRDRVVGGVRDQELQKRLFAEPNLTFQKAYDMAMSHEATTANNITIKQEIGGNSYDYASHMSHSQIIANLDTGKIDIDGYNNHDIKHNIFDLQQHQTNNIMQNNQPASVAQHMNGINLTNIPDNRENNAAAGDTKPLAKFTIKDNFFVHPAHKIEEGIFQHMNKLPAKKKEALKQFGVSFTGQMSSSEKSTVVQNFTRFCQEYNLTDHRPFLALNQNGMLKQEQIKFARYLGQGLPTFTLFCNYSNFKNLFCTKRFENENNYDLPQILNKITRFLANSTDACDVPINNKCNTIIKADSVPKPLHNLQIIENYEVHETHRIEEGIHTHMSRVSPKKQELLKQLGIERNPNITYYEKHLIIDNFIKFCNTYNIQDHQPFLDFTDSGLVKSEQIKFVRFLGQGLPNLTLYKIYLIFKDVLGLNRIEKITFVHGYNLDIILKRKKKLYYNRYLAAVKKENEAAKKQQQQQQQQPQQQPQQQQQQQPQQTATTALSIIK